MFIVILYLLISCNFVLLKNNFILNSILVSKMPLKGYFNAV